MKTVVLNVSGMSCGHCEKAVTMALWELKGIDEVKASAEVNTVTVTYDESLIGLQEINDTIEEEGYQVVD